MKLSRFFASDFRYSIKCRRKFLNPTVVIQTSQISKGRKQNRDKPKLTIEEPKAKVVEESNLNQMTNPEDEQKKDCLPEVPHSRVQPTTEQLMMARLIDGHSNYGNLGFNMFIRY